MPKTNIDYSIGLIYKIVCDDINITDIYIGSTTNFIQRKYKHKSLCCKKDNRKIYQFINNNGGWNNWSMIEIEKYPCKDKRELELRERYWYELLNTTLNATPPFKTENEKKQLDKDYQKKKREIKKQLTKD